MKVTVDKQGRLFAGGKELVVTVGGIKLEHPMIENTEVKYDAKEKATIELINKWKEDNM